MDNCNIIRSKIIVYCYWKACLRETVGRELQYVEEKKESYLPSIIIHGCHKNMSW